MNGTSGTPAHGIITDTCIHIIYRTGGWQFQNCPPLPLSQKHRTTVGSWTYFLALPTSCHRAEMSQVEGQHKRC